MTWIILILLIENFNFYVNLKSGLNFVFCPSVLQLQSIGVNPQFITFTNVTMESDKYICVRETSPQNSVVIIDMNMPMQPLRRPITADSALMNPNTRILALKGMRSLLRVFNCCCISLSYWFV